MNSGSNPARAILLERLTVVQIRRIRRENNAPQIQRCLLRPAYSMSDMKEGLEGVRHEGLAAFFKVQSAVRSCIYKIRRYLKILTPEIEVYEPQQAKARWTAGCGADHRRRADLGLLICFKRD